MHKWMLTTSLVIAAGLALFGCTGDQKKDAEPVKGDGKTVETPKAALESGLPKRDKPYVIGMSQCNLGEPWRVQMNADVKAAADQYKDLKVEFRDAENDSLKQRGHVEEFVASKVDLIIISPKEAQPLTEPVSKAYKAGIPVIVLDRAVMGEDYTMFIGADNVKIGKAAGEWLAKKLGGKGTIVELKGLMTSVPGQDRNKGFREGIAGSEIKVAFEADMKWLEPDSRKEMESALAKLPKIDAVYAHNDPGAHGAYLAAEAAGRAKDIVFVGIDALPQEGVEYVKKGILSATFQYPTGGKEAIEYAIKILKGEKPEKKLVLGSRLFTKDTLPDGEVIK